MKMGSLRSRDRSPKLWVDGRYASRVCEGCCLVDKLGRWRKERRLSPVVSLAEIGSGVVHSLASISRHVFVLMLVLLSTYMHF